MSYYAISKTGKQTQIRCKECGSNKITIQKIVKNEENSSFVEVTMICQKSVCTNFTKEQKLVFKDTTFIERKRAKK